MTLHSKYASSTLIISAGQLNVILEIFNLLEIKNLLCACAIRKVFHVSNQKSYFKSSINLFFCSLYEDTHLTSAFK